jgi:hypothetical protein
MGGVPMKKKCLEEQRQIPMGDEKKQNNFHGEKSNLYCLFLNGLEPRVAYPVRQGQQSFVTKRLEKI